MRESLGASAARGLRWAGVAALVVGAGLCALLPGATAWARAPEAPPAHMKPLPNPPPAPIPATSPKSSPTPPDAALTLPLTFRLVTWPVWMVLSGMDGDKVPPMLELSFGYRKRWFELSMGIGIAAGPVYDSPGTYFGMMVAVGFYSYRRGRVRLRHGLEFGIASEVVFERHPPQSDLTPLPMARVRLLDILVRVGKGLWLEISPLTASFPGMYEASVGLRVELDAPAKKKSAASGPPPDAPDTGKKLHGFVSVEMGLVWWQHFQPPVLGSTFGRVGFRYRWFETAIGFGSPAWATWRGRGLYELFVDLGFYSLRRARLRLRHQVRLGVLFHNPPFEPHTWSGVVMHADFCIVAVALGRGFWAEFQPLTISIAPRDQLSSSVALRYEF